MSEYPNHRWSRQAVNIRDRYECKTWVGRRCPTCKKGFAHGEVVDVLDVRYSYLRGEDDRYFFHEGCECRLEDIGFLNETCKRRKS